MFLQTILGSSLIMMLGFEVVLAYLGAVANEFISRRGSNECRLLFLWLVQYGTRGKCPAFCCNHFFVSALNCRFMHIQLNSTVQSIPCQSNNIQQARQCSRLNYDQIQRFYVHLIASQWIAAWLQGETSDQDIMEPVLDWTPMHIHWKIKKFLLRVTGSLAMTQMTSQTSNSALAIQTVNLLYL
jgi:hypothetical protein